MALKPASKRIRLTDESVNSHGFWTLTAGINTDLFSQNPLLLWNHIRPEGNNKDQVLPIGVIQELRVEPDGSMTGLPAFDDSDPFAMRIHDKYEAGIINMSSLGLDPKEVLKDKKFLKGSSKAPCLSKSDLMEVSLCDIGSNRNSVKLYTKTGPVNLKSADDLIKLFFSSENTDTMDFTKEVRELLKLSDNTSDADVLASLKTEQGKIATLTNDLNLKTQEVNDLKKQMATDKVTNLVEKAVDDKKILPAEKDAYVKLANADFDTTKALLDAKKPYVSIQTQMNDASVVDQARLAELMKLSGKELFMQNKLDELKTLSLPSFKAKYKEYTGVDYAE